MIPPTDSWTATSVPNDVLGHAGHTAVWTSSEMIIWGGGDSTLNDCNTGGRYNPMNDSWMATDIGNAPSPRAGHSAVWTGSEMIVWGGASAVRRSILTQAGDTMPARTVGYPPASQTRRFPGLSQRGVDWQRNGHLGWRLLSSVWQLHRLITGGRYCEQFRDRRRHNCHVDTHSPLLRT